ncbi:hypothetical protein S245_065205 [Arachis hypogaea]
MSRSVRCASPSSLAFLFTGAAKFVEAHVHTRRWFVNLLEACKTVNPQPAIVWALSSSMYGINSKISFSEFCTLFIMFNWNDINPKYITSKIETTCTICTIEESLDGRFANLPEAEIAPEVAKKGGKGKGVGWTMNFVLV